MLWQLHEWKKYLSEKKQHVSYISVFQYYYIISAESTEFCIYLFVFKTEIVNTRHVSPPGLDSKTFERWQHLDLSSK